jgi:hypothetical protein
MLDRFRARVDDAAELAETLRAALNAFSGDVDSSEAAPPTN